MIFKSDERRDVPPPLPQPRVVPLLPLRDIIVFPHMVVPLFVGREKSIKALEESMRTDKEILLSAQVKAKTNDLEKEMSQSRLPKGTVTYIIKDGKKIATKVSFKSRAGWGLKKKKKKKK